MILTSDGLKISKFRTPSAARRRLINFKNFYYHGGGGLKFFDLVGDDGGSVAWLTPLPTNTFDISDSSALVDIASILTNISVEVRT